MRLMSVGQLRRPINRRIESDRAVYINTQPASEAIAAISWPANPPHSPVSPNRTNERNRWPRLPFANMVLF